MSGSAALRFSQLLANLEYDSFMIRSKPFENLELSVYSLGRSVGLLLVRRIGILEKLISQFLSDFQQASTI